MINLSPAQQTAVNELLVWYKNPNKSPYITLGGYAGTGKTTLMSYFREQLFKQHKKAEVAFCSYTGKATRVLKTKLSEGKISFKQDSVSTIHSLIYSPIVDKNEQIIGWENKEKLSADLIVVDEASMVDEKIWKDLLSYRIPVIAVGDHGQLPPIQGKFNLMSAPKLRLEEIYRQAEDNPIIELSIQAREQGRIAGGKYGRNVVKLNRNETDDQEVVTDILTNFNDETLVLCGFNTTRIKLNNYIRSSLGFELQIPQRGDRVICLRNNHAKRIFNGMLGTIETIETVDDDWYEAQIQMDGEKGMYKGLIPVAQFNSQAALNYGTERAKYNQGDLFDFGYALTVHKAQGSQARRVVLFEERSSHMDEETWRRWLYTGITRAESELFIVGN